MTDYSMYSTRPKPRWGRIVGVWAILIALMVTMFSCQASHADELPIPVQTIIGECANCSDEGMIAVANVIRNRAKYRNQTVEAVCLASGQFSCWNDKTWLVGHLKRNKGVTARAWSAWQASSTEDLTKGADMYHASYVRPRWNWAKLDYLGKVGAHLFYREHK